MKLLKEILYGTRIQDILGNTNVAIRTWRLTAAR